MIEQGRRTYSSPEDDCETPILAAINAATTELRVIDYTLTWGAFVDACIARRQAGVDVRFILDRSEAGIHTEHPLVQALRAAGVPVMIGTSQRKRIVHDKLAVIDGQAVVSGSFNFSTVAELETNFVDIETGNPLRANFFLGVFDRLWSWIAANEPQTTS